MFPRPSAAVLVLLCAIPVASLHAQKGNEAILAAVTRYDSAWAKKDTAALGTLLASEYRYFTSLGLVVDRAGAVAFVTDTAYKLAGWERSQLAVHRTGSLAVVESRWFDRGRVGTQSFADNQRCSLTLVEAKRGWQVASEHCTQIDQAGTTTARPGDVATLDSIMLAVYDVISGPAGQKRDWDRFRSLFAPGARLIPTGRRPDSVHVMRVMSPDDYAAQSGPGLEANGFFEREIGRRVEQYGAITHVFSAYDSKRTAADPQPFARGINSFQLFNDGKRWWIVTIYWEAERPDNRIPEKYLARP